MFCFDLKLFLMYDKKFIMNSAKSLRVDIKLKLVKINAINK